MVNNKPPKKKTWLLNFYNNKTMVNFRKGRSFALDFVMKGAH